MRYRYYNYIRKSDGAHVCVVESTYGKKRYKGKSICAPQDEYDEEFGYQLAKLRCDEKIETARIKYLYCLIDNKKKEIADKTNELNKLNSRLATSCSKYIQQQEILKKIYENTLDK